MKRVLEWVGGVLVERSKDNDENKTSQTLPLITDPVKVVPKEELKSHKKLLNVLSEGKDKFESPSLQIRGFEGLTLEDLETLSPGLLISSSVLNIWLKLLQRTLNERGVKTLCLSSHFFTKLTKSMDCDQLNGSWKLDSGSDEFYCYNSVKRWTREKRLPQGCKTVLDLDILLFPVHLKSRYHWMISIIHVKSRQVIVYNSLRSADFDEEEKWVAYIVERWWVDEYTDKTQVEEDEWPPNLEHIILKDIPQQVNSTDCGAFCLAYAYYACFHNVIPDKSWPVEFNGENLRTSVGYNLLNQSPLLKYPENISPPAMEYKDGSDDAVLKDDDVVLIKKPKKRIISNIAINLT